MTRTAVAVGLIMALLLVAACVFADAPYEPVVPEGYVGKVVLHIDYGTGPGEIRMMIPKGGDYPQYPWMTKHHYDHLSVVGLQVVGDRFYLIDNTSQRINMYRSPGQFVWRTDELENLHFVQATPDGKLYATWGAAVAKLSLIDETGKVVWTKEKSDIVPAETLDELAEKYGFSELSHNLGRLGWTRQGLSIKINGTRCDTGKTDSLSLLLDNEGKLAKGLPGEVLLSSGVACNNEMDLGNKVATYRIVCRTEAGEVVNTIAPDFASSKCLGDPKGIFFERFWADPAKEGYLIYGSRFLPSRVQLTSFLDSGVESILLRLGTDGSLREEWKHASSPFESTHPALIVAPDGNVYHLKFMETGVDVVQYSRS